MPFRTYMAVPTTTAKRIAIGSRAESIGNAEDHAENEMSMNEMTAYSINHNIIIDSNYADDVLIYNAGGQLVRAVKVYEGSNLYTGFTPGVYIINGKKLLVR